MCNSTPNGTPVATIVLNQVATAVSLRGTSAKGLRDSCMRLCRKHPTYSGRGVAAPRVPGPHSVFTGIETTHFIKTCNKPQPDTFRSKFLVENYLATLHVQMRTLTTKLTCSISTVRSSPLSAHFPSRIFSSLFSLFRG